MPQTPQQSGQPTDLLIKANELVYLNNIIEGMPTKFGLPLVNFFSQVAAMRQQEAVVATQSKEENKANDTPDVNLSQEKTKTPRAKKTIESQN